MDKYLQERQEMNRRYNAPENRKMKYTALAVMAVVALLLLTMAFMSDSISPKAMLIMRGCAGAGALIFVVLVGVLTYRVNKSHIVDRH